jgi:hypothetical protein
VPGRNVSETYAIACTLLKAMWSHGQTTSLMQSARDDIREAYANAQ